MSIEDIKEALAEKSESSGEVNYTQLREGLTVVTRIANIVLGVLIVAIIILVPLIVSLEIIYITFPVIRVKADEILNEVEGKGFLRKIAGFTLRDAKEAVEQANTVQIGEKSALWIYLKLKCKSLMFVMFIVALIMMGSSTIIDFVWGLIEQFINLIT